MAPNLPFPQYVMRDHYFPRDMRAPVLSAEFNQLAAYAALRLVTLKVNTWDLPTLSDSLNGNPFVFCHILLAHSRVPG